MHSVSKHVRLSELIVNIGMEIDLHYQRRGCSPVTVVSASMKFMRIFAGVPWRGGVKRQWGKQERRFSGLSDAASSAS